MRETRSHDTLEYVEEVKREHGIKGTCQSFFKDSSNVTLAYFHHHPTPFQAVIHCPIWPPLDMQVSGGFGGSSQAESFFSHPK